MEIEIHFGFQAIAFEHRSEAAKTKGLKLIQAGHVVEVVERKIGKNLSFIRAHVIRQTKVNANPYAVELEIDEQRCVIGAKCDCIAGAAGFCKHISALVLYINSEFAKSKTSTSNEWVGSVVSTKKAGHAKYSKGKRIQDLYLPPAEKKNYLASAISLNQLPDTPSALRVMLLAEAEAEAQDTDENETLEMDRLYQLIFMMTAIYHGPAILEDIVVFAMFPFLLLVFFVCFRNDGEFSNLISLILENQKKEDIVANPNLPKFTQECCHQTFEEWIEGNAFDICRETKMNKQRWHEERIYFLRCYELYTYTRNKNADWDKKIKNYVLRKPFSNEAVRHGICCEEEARNKYQEFYKSKVIELGLVILQNRPWLAASPDGIVLKNGLPEKLIEIKCPLKGKSAPIHDVLKSCQFLKIQEDDNHQVQSITLKKKHGYYAQIQINLVCLGLKSCDLMLYSSFNQSFEIVKVDIDIEFCNKIIKCLEGVFYKRVLHFLCKLKSMK